MNNKKYYSVYNAKTDMPVMIHGTVKECAKCMGLSSIGSFYKTRRMVKIGKNSKWVILEDKDD